MAMRLPWWTRTSQPYRWQNGWFVLDGASLASALDACLQLLPLDTFVDRPVSRMMQVHAPDEVPVVQQECQEIIDRHEARHVATAAIPREEFHRRAKDAYAVVQTAEPRGYGCILLKKSVIF
jgi:L-fucose mutarotase